MPCRLLSRHAFIPPTWRRVMAAPCRDRTFGGDQGFGVVYMLVLIAVASLARATLAERGGLAWVRADYDMQTEQARAYARAGAEHAVWRLGHEDCYLGSHAGETFNVAFAKGQYTYTVSGST